MTTNNSMMSLDLTENPCEGEGFVFDPENVTIEQKEWLTKQMVSQSLTPAYIAKKYKLNRRNLINWSSRYRKGLKRRTQEGRPRVLDKCALVSLQNWLDEDETHVEDIQGLKRVINESYRATKRRYVEANDTGDSDGNDNNEGDGIDDEFSHLKLCKGSMFNYLYYAGTDKINDIIESL